MLLAEDDGWGQRAGRDLQNLDAPLQYFLDSQPEDREASNMDRIGTQPIADSGERPAQRVVCLNRHQAMRDFAKHWNRSAPVKFLVLDSLEQTGARSSPRWVRLEMISENIGIHKNRVAGKQVVDAHGASGGGG